MRDLLQIQQGTLPYLAYDNKKKKKEISDNSVCSFYWRIMDLGRKDSKGRKA